MTAAIGFIQWLHILGGITWFGAYVFLDFVVWPVLLRMPPAEAVKAHDAILFLATRILAVVAPATVALGIVRGTLLGDLHSPADLLQPYGLTWSAALVVSVALMVWGARWHTSWLGPVWVGGAVSPAGARRVKLGVGLEMSAFSLILACMVLMGLGW